MTHDRIWQYPFGDSAKVPSNSRITTFWVIPSVLQNPGLTSLKGPFWSSVLGVKSNAWRHFMGLFQSLFDVLARPAPESKHDKPWHIDEDLYKDRSQDHTLLASFLGECSPDRTCDPHHIIPPTLSCPDMQDWSQALVRELFEKETLGITAAGVHSFLLLQPESIKMN